MTAGPNVLTVHLMGGLGNQLFQYAFGRRLTLANDAQLFLDASGYEASAASDSGMAVRRCELQHFNIVGTIIGPAAQPTLPHQLVSRWWRKALRWLRQLTDAPKPYYARSEIIEPTSMQFQFDGRVLRRPIRGLISCRGFWQSEKYFTEIEPQLRRELTLSHTLDSSSRDVAAEIGASDSIGVHVRHGDNATAIAPALGVLSADYYRHAVAAIQDEIQKPRFFVFSDDPLWAHDLLGEVASARFVENTAPGRGYVDLWLMSRCKHHILANSTLGWWAAWLGRHPQQIVYAPRRYYQNLDLPNPDLYPQTWRLT